MSGIQSPRGPAPTSVRQVVSTVGGMFVAFGLYSWFSALDDPWGYRQVFGAVVTGVGSVLLVTARLWPRSASARAAAAEPPSPLDPGEPILKQGGANRAGKWGNVGGWLYLTDARLVFVPQGFGSRPAVSIPLADVVAAEPGRTLGLIPNTLRLRTAGGCVRFVVWGRRGWAEAILSAQDKHAEPGAAADSENGAFS